MTPSHKEKVTEEQRDHRAHRVTLSLRHLVIFFGLLAAAALVRFGIAARLNELPANYARETHYAGEDDLCETPNGAWEKTATTLRRVDQTIASTSETAIVQGDLHVYAENDAVVFESTGLYGVSRFSRQNVLGYGDTERTGQFLFPPDIQPTTYTYWDPMFIGPRVATFDHVETQAGLAVYVFRFSATGLDETAGYSYLPDVPEHYAARTDGQGTLWVEPVSGVVVDYAEQGMSYFADPTTGRQIADFHRWSDRYTPETHTAQRQLATEARLRVLALQVWLPVGLIFAGLIWLGVGLWNSRRTT
ncbi:MAG: porin PorA family protein [Chloroflexi bacterium]|nr:porin PorA family protein [Chloroflexota bacterium]